MADKNNPIESIDLSMKQLAAGFGGRNLKEGGSAGVAIQALADEIAEQNKIAQDNKTDFDRNKILMDLVLSTEASDKEGKANSLALRSQFKDSQERLARAIENGDDKAAQLERDNQSEILDNAETEENRREANKAVEKQSTLLGKISSGIGGLVGFAKDNAMAIGGGLLAGLAIFAPEVMEKLVKRVVEVLGKAFEIVKSLLDGDIDGALELFKGEWKAFTGAFIFFFGGTIVKTLKGVFKGFKILKKAVQTYRMFLATEYAGSMFAHFKDMMKNLGSKLMKIVRGLGRAAKIFFKFITLQYVPQFLTHLKDMTKNLGGKFMKLLRGMRKAAIAFRVFMMLTFFPAMGAALMGMATSLLAILVPFAIPIAIGLAIAAVVGLIALAMIKMRDALGFASVFDLITLTLAHAKDRFAHLNNFIADVVDWIGGIIEKGGEFLGLEFDLPRMERLATDNMAKTMVELKEKGRKAKEKEAEEKRLRELDPNAAPDAEGMFGFELPDFSGMMGGGGGDDAAALPGLPADLDFAAGAGSTGDDIDFESQMNSLMQEQASNAAASKAPPVVVSQKGGTVTNNNTTNNSSRSYKRPRAWGSHEINSSYA